MKFLIAVLILVGGIIAYFAFTTPRRTLKLLTDSAAKQARVHRLTTLLNDLGRLTEHSRVLIEQASSRPEHEFAAEEIELLVQIRSLCQDVLPGLDKESPILNRYYRNHVAVLTYVLGESDAEASTVDRFKNALAEIARYQRVEKSGEPLAVLEKNLATGQSV